MLADTNRRSLKQWRSLSSSIGYGIRAEMEKAPTGAILSTLQGEQVALIKSLPSTAAERVHELAMGAIPSGARASTLEAEILSLGNITENRARLIARTEVGRANSNLLQARAQWAGSDGYIWRTAHDGDVRHSHAEMNGKYVRWGQPPTLDKMTGHAGCLPNCRCIAEPIFPDF